MFTNQQVDINNLPLQENLELKSISNKYLIVIILNFLILFSMLCGIISTIYFIKPIWLFGISIWVILAVPITLLALVFLTYYIGFKYRKYALREKDIIYSEGFLVNKLTIVSFNRVQHTEVSRSFIERKLGLSSLSVFTAGESGGDLKIRGLNKDKAKVINTLLIKIINERL